MMTTRILFVPALAALLPATPGLAAPAHAAIATPSPTRAEASLLAAEDARFAAQVRHDYTAVAAGLADELVYSHGSGQRQSRDEYLAALQGGHLDYRSIAATDRIVHVYGQVGVTRAILTMQVGDAVKRGSMLGVYIHRAGRWQLVSWQTTPLPDA